MAARRSESVSIQSVVRPVGSEGCGVAPESDLAFAKDTLFPSASGAGVGAVIASWGSSILPAAESGSERA